MHLRSGMIAASRPRDALWSMATCARRGAKRPSSIKPAPTGGPAACDRQTFRWSSTSGTPPRYRAPRARAASMNTTSTSASPRYRKELVAAGFERTVLLITAEAPKPACSSGRRGQTQCPPTSSSPSTTTRARPLYEKWSYEGEEHDLQRPVPRPLDFHFLRQSQLRGRASNSASCSATQLKARGLKYTHALYRKLHGQSAAHTRGCRSRRLPLRPACGAHEDAYAGRPARSGLDRQSRRGIGVGDAGAPIAHQRRRRRCRRELLRGASTPKSRSAYPLCTRPESVRARGSALCDGTVAERRCAPINPARAAAETDIFATPIQIWPPCRCEQPAVPLALRAGAIGG